MENSKILKNVFFLIWGVLIIWNFHLVTYATDDSYTIKIPKMIELNENKEATYEINVIGTVASNVQINIEPQDNVEDEEGINFYMIETTSKKQAIANVTQDETSWLCNAVNTTNGTTKSGTINAIGLSAGEWEGSLDFKISLSEHEHDYNDDGICNDCGDIKTNEALETLNGYTWSEVQAICKEGKANEYFSIGDTTTINIDELPNASNTTEAQIATIVVGDISDDGTTMTMLVTSYSTLAPTHVMNTMSTNAGGWEASEMRTWLNDEYLSALSSDLQNVITTHSTSYSARYNVTSVSYCDDKVWLLSSKEVFGGGTATSASGSTTSYENLAAFNAETQLAYFANGASRVRYSSDANACYWWLRSSGYNLSIYFTDVSSDGSSDRSDAYISFYVFPAFDIGYKEESKETLNGYTWSEVQAICQAGNAKSYFEVGDTTIISLGALPNAYNTTSAQTMTIVVGDLTDTSLTLLVTSYSIEAPTHCMNTGTTSVGGWASTSMRTWLNDEYLSALSSDLQNVITTHSTSYSATYNATSVSYCNDKVWLLSSKEVFGGDTAKKASYNTTYYENLYAFNTETQLAYFANGASRVRYRSGTNTCTWWLRSSHCDYNGNFTYVDSDGSSNYYGAVGSRYVFPAFDIG